MKKWMWEKEWNKKAVQVTAAFTSVTLAAGCAGAGRMGGTSSGNASESMQAEIGEGKAGPYVTSAQRNRLGLSDADLRNLSKDETVYVISGADGGVQKIIVSDWIKNSMGSSQIQDLTELSDISNVKGMETFEAKGRPCGHAFFLYKQAEADRNGGRRGAGALCALCSGHQHDAG